MAPTATGAVLAMLLATACGAKDAARPEETDTRRRPKDQREAEALGREIFELVDRAIDYRGSHQGRPAASFRQMGVDSLTPSTARSMVNLAREPVVTVTFRRTDGREITSCRGDGQILEESAMNGGRFSVMCTARSGAQRPMRIGD